MSSSSPKLALQKRLHPSHSSRSYSLNEERFSQVVLTKNTSSEHKSPHLINKRKYIDQIVISEKETSLSGFRKNELSNSSCKDVTTGYRKVITSREELILPIECLNKKSFPDEQKILVLIPKHSPKTNCEDIVDEKSKETNQETFT